ncbi:hypothetical protein B0H16DRAFT_1452162 [Mycena metata]|uniref:Uncharacterized protein n=1 Tax=Mycena metata TaxID=1033252 RepID=A0AAD7NPW9_9AGAR|nr:hypothetical protein B0H16DRAFT_1452162 [Mycena metata]
MPNTSTATPYLPLRVGTITGKARKIYYALKRVLIILRKVVYGNSMQQAKSAAMVSKKGVSKKGCARILQGEVAVDYSTSSKKRFPDAGEEGEDACPDALERTDEDETPILAVVLAASAAFANNAPRTGEEIEKGEERERGDNDTKLTDSITLAGGDIEQPEVFLAIGIANGVVFAPHEDIFGDADLHSNCTLEVGLGDGSGDNSVVDRGGDGGATVQVAGYAVARVETAVSEVQRGLVPGIDTAGNDAQGPSTVTVGDVHVDLALGSSTKTAGSEGGGGAAMRDGGAGHGRRGNVAKARETRNVAKGSLRDQLGSQRTNKGRGKSQRREGGASEGREKPQKGGRRESDEREERKMQTYTRKQVHTDSIHAEILAAKPLSKVGRSPYPPRVGDPPFRQANWRVSHRRLVGALFLPPPSSIHTNSTSLPSLHSTLCPHPSSSHPYSPRPPPPPSRRRTLVGGTPTRDTFVNNRIPTSTRANGPSGFNSWITHRERTADSTAEHKSARQPNENTKRMSRALSPPCAAYPAFHQLNLSTSPHPQHPPARAEPHRVPSLSPRLYPHPLRRTVRISAVPSPREICIECAFLWIPRARSTSNTSNTSMSSRSRTTSAGAPRTPITANTTRTTSTASSPRSPITAHPRNNFGDSAADNGDRHYRPARAQGAGATSAARKKEGKEGREGREGKGRRGRDDDDQEKQS